MKNLLLLAFLCHSLSVAAQPARCDSTYRLGDTLVCYDRVSKRFQTHRYYLGDRQLFVRHVHRYKNGRVKIQTKRGKSPFSDRHGPAWEYYPSGKIRGMANFVDDKLEGYVPSFYEDGKPQCQCNYRNGKRDGDQRMYFANGQLYLHARAAAGRPMDIYALHDETGRALDPGTVKNGTGVLYVYDKKWRRTKEITVRDGKKVRTKRL